LFAFSVFAAPPPPAGSNQVSTASSGAVPVPKSDLSVDSISLNEPIEEGDNLGGSTAAIKIKNLGPGSTRDFTP